VSAWPEVSDSERAICDDMVRLARGLWLLEQPMLESFRFQHVHGDFWDNNVLFNDEDEITAVLDLDFSGWRPRTDDIALVLYYATATPDRKTVDPDHLHWLRRCVEAYDSSLDDPLTPHERGLLPLALARTVLFMTRNILALEEDASDYGAPALPAQRQMLAGMARELTWSRDLLDQAAEAQAIFVG
jgi:Ser/Thr protein kinase RdoA (MazF antagonist)